MSTYLLLLLPQNVLKNKNKTNALTLKTALNHMNWSLGYLNSKMMCVNTDQHLRCRAEASRGRCSWPVWQKADRARTPPRPERQKTSWKNPRSNLKCLSSCNSPLTIREVQHRWKSNTLPFWYNDRSRVACQIHARFSKQLWLFLMNPQWGHRLIPVLFKVIGKWLWVTSWVLNFLDLLTCMGLSPCIEQFEVIKKKQPFFKCTYDCRWLWFLLVP